jgi:hypothetical protein
MPVQIIKADGTQEPFARQKLLASLTKAGASASSAEHIVEEVEKNLTEGAHTTDIYRTAFSLLRKKEPHGTAARYSLRRALLEFGPSGFPFEQYLAELFRSKGYEAATNLIVPGKCVEHEIDVLLTKDGINTYIEAKFHNTPGFKTDLKVALYVKARIDDLRAVDPSAQGLLVTNTKLTSKAFAFAQCAGLPLMTWEYPGKESLQALIEETKLYPVTALASLTKREKEALINEKVVLCSAVPRQGDFLRTLGLKEQRLNDLFEEVGALCG